MWENLLITGEKNGFSLVIQNTEGSASLQMNRQEDRVSQVYIPKWLLCFWWSICKIVQFEVLKPGPTVNTFLYRDLLDRVNQSSIEKWQTVFKRLKRNYNARRTLEKIDDFWLEVVPYLPYSPESTPSDFNIF